MNAPAAPRRPFLVRLGNFIRFSHTVFALPFALMAMLAAGEGRVPLRVFGWILVCMVSARTMAMCFNRLMDWEIDKLNPRTDDRHRLVSKPQAWSVCVLSCAVAIWGAAQLSPLCLRLSPLMVLIVCFYSLTKRFTSYTHLFLGLALAVAPMGAWVAVRARLWEPAPLWLSGAVLFWTFGFDLIYSTLDADFDRAQGLRSFPARHGTTTALRLARFLHAAAFLGFLAFGKSAGLGSGYWSACALTLGALWMEHRLARSPDPVQINLAFFQINAVVSLSLLAGTVWDFKLWNLLRA